MKKRQQLARRKCSDRLSVETGQPEVGAPWGMAASMSAYLCGADDPGKGASFQHLDPN
jgi:hypothetical protein